MTFKKPEPVVGKIKSNSSPRNRRKRKGGKSKQAAEHGNGEVEEGDLNGDEEQARGSEHEVLWAVGDDSDDEDEGEDEDVDHHQHPLHQDLPKAKIPSAVIGGSQRRNSRRAVNERTGLVSTEDEGEDGEYLDARMMETSRRRSMDPFRDFERHEMHNVPGEISSHNGRPQR